MEGGGGQRTRAGVARILRDVAAGGECENRDPAGTIASGHHTMFSFFKKQKPALDKEETEARLERVERVIRDLRLDWESTYDKFRLLHARISKRVEREEELRAAEATTTEGETPQESVLPGAVPPPRRMIIRSRILRR